MNTRRHRTTRRLIGGLAATVAAAALGGAAAVPASAYGGSVAQGGSAPCRTLWGTGERGAQPVPPTPAAITGVRAGRHACFDRVVIDVGGDVAKSGVAASYVRQVTQDGSGDVVPLRGGARLQVTIGNPVYDRHGTIVYDPKDRTELVPTRGYRTLRQVALAGSFEGVTTIGVGVAQKRPFRVFILDGAAGDRVVLDIAHR